MPIPDWIKMRIPVKWATDSAEKWATDSGN
jgi:hypothetical protein